MLTDCAHIIRAVGEALRRHDSDYHAVIAGVAAADRRAGPCGDSARRGARAGTGAWTTSGARSPCSSVPPAGRMCGPAGVPAGVVQFDSCRVSPDADQGDQAMSTSTSSLFGIYPYVALTVFFAGSLLRFDRDQYTWKSESSQMLRAGQLRWGSNLFHLGILGIFFGHLFGLLTPLAVWHALGVTAGAKQALAVIAGGVAGARCAWSDWSCSIHRRLTEPRIRATSRPADLFSAVAAARAAAARPLQHHGVAAAHGRRGDGEADDVGAARRHLPRRCRRLRRRCVLRCSRRTCSWA